MEADNLVCRADIRAHRAGRLGVDGSSMGHRAGSQIDEEVGADRDSISLDNKPWSVYTWNFLLLGPIAGSALILRMNRLGL